MHTTCTNIYKHSYKMWCLQLFLTIYHGWPSLVLQCFNFNPKNVPILRIDHIHNNSIYCIHIKRNQLLINSVWSFLSTNQDIHAPTIFHTVQVFHRIYSLYTCKCTCVFSGLFLWKQLWYKKFQPYFLMNEKNIKISIWIASARAEKYPCICKCNSSNIYIITALHRLRKPH